jgi:hypothetical protein
VGKKGALFIAERSGAAEVVGTGVGWVRYRCGLGQVQVLVGLVLSWAVSWTLFSAGLLARLRGILA